MSYLAQRFRQQQRFPGSLPPRQTPARRPDSSPLGFSPQNGQILCFREYNCFQEGRTAVRMVQMCVVQRGRRVWDVVQSQGQAAGDNAECGTAIPMSFCLWGLPWYQELLEEFGICLPISKLWFDTPKNKLCCKLWGFIMALLVY